MGLTCRAIESLEWCAARCTEEGELELELELEGRIGIDWPCETLSGDGRSAFSRADGSAPDSGSASDESGAAAGAAASSVGSAVLAFSVVGFVVDVGVEIVVVVVLGVAVAVAVAVTAATAGKFGAGKDDEGEGEGEGDGDDINAAMVVSRSRPLDNSGTMSTRSAFASPIGGGDGSEMVDTARGRVALGCSTGANMTALWRCEMASSSLSARTITIGLSDRKLLSGRRVGDVLGDLAELAAAGGAASGGTDAEAAAAADVVVVGASSGLESFVERLTPSTEERFFFMVVPTKAHSSTCQADAVPRQQARENEQQAARERECERDGEEVLLLAAVLRRLCGSEQIFDKIKIQMPLRLRLPLSHSFIRPLVLAAATATMGAPPVSPPPVENVSKVKAATITKFAAITGIVTIVVCYVLAVREGHVPKWLPMVRALALPRPRAASCHGLLTTAISRSLQISDCAVYPPESYLFRVGIISSALMIFVTSVLFYFFLSSTTGRHRFDDKVGVFLAGLATLGLALVGAINEDENGTVHGASAVVFFTAFIFYMILSTVRLWRYKNPNFTVSKTSLTIKATTTVIGLVALIAFALMSTPPSLARSLTHSHSFVDDFASLTRRAGRLELGQVRHRHCHLRVGRHLDDPLLRAVVQPRLWRQRVRREPPGRHLGCRCPCGARRRRRHVVGRLRCPTLRCPASAPDACPRCELV